MQYEWDDEKKAWFPYVDDDFIARYQANYGEYDPQNVPAAASSTDGKKQPPKTENDAEKEKEKEKLANMTSDERKDYLKQQKKDKRRLAAENERKRGTCHCEQPCHVKVDLQDGWSLKKRKIATSTSPACRQTRPMQSSRFSFSLFNR
jgi:hypothetical protein